MDKQKVVDLINKHLLVIESISDGDSHVYTLVQDTSKNRLVIEIISELTGVDEKIIYKDNGTIDILEWASQFANYFDGRKFTIKGDIVHD